jgi:hypothetical protein
MARVTAVISFTHNGQSYKRGLSWEESERQAEALRRAGLVRMVESVNAVPRPAPGAKLSASPVAQVSPPQTPQPSRRGRKRKTAEPSLSPTPPSA